MMVFVYWYGVPNRLTLSIFNFLPWVHPRLRCDGVFSLVVSDCPPWRWAVLFLISNSRASDWAASSVGESKSLHSLWKVSNGHEFEVQSKTIAPDYDREITYSFPSVYIRKLSITDDRPDARQRQVVRNGTRAQWFDKFRPCWSGNFLSLPEKWNRIAWLWFKEWLKFLLSFYFPQYFNTWQIQISIWYENFILYMYNEL